MKGYEEKIIYSAESPFSIQLSEHPEQMNAHWHPQIELMFFTKLTAANTYAAISASLCEKTTL